MDKKKRFAIFHAVHEILDWSSVFSWYGLAALVFIYPIGPIPALPCIILGVTFLFIDLFAWRPFAVEYAIYRCLEHGESLRNNLPSLRAIEFRYSDYLEVDCQHKHLNPALFGATYYIIVLTVNSFNRDIIAPWATLVAIIAVIITAAISAGLIVAKLFLRFRRRHNPTTEIYVCEPSNRYDCITTTVAKAHRYY